MWEILRKYDHELFCIGCKLIKFCEAQIIEENCIAKVESSESRVGHLSN